MSNSNANYDVQIKINGVVVPYSIKNTVLAVQNVNVALPSARISLLDPSNIFAKDLPLNDGAILELTVGDNRTDPRNGTYRIFGTPQRSPHSDGIAQYGVHAILDAIPYISSNPLRAITGSATSAVKEIANQVGFNLINNVSTNDVMQWLPGRKTWNGFAELLANHGWANETSALHIGVDMAKNLHFHDITQLFSKGDIKMCLFHGEPPKKVNVPLRLVSEYKAENHSGMQNNTFGYGLRMPETNLLSGEIKKLVNVKAMTVNNLIDMSSSVLKSIGSRGRLDIPRISVGNSHDNFITAKHQNLRIKSTYSQVLNVLTEGCSGLTLFDMVQFSSVSNTQTDDSVSGIYCVTGISSAIKGRRFKEKLVLTSSGPQNSNPGLV